MSTKPIILLLTWIHFALSFVVYPSSSELGGENDGRTSVRDINIYQISGHLSNNDEMVDIKNHRSDFHSPVDVYNTSDKSIHVNFPAHLAYRVKLNKSNGGARSNPEEFAAEMYKSQSALFSYLPELVILEIHEAGEDFYLFTIHTTISHDPVSQSVHEDETHNEEIVVEETVVSQNFDDYALFIGDEPGQGSSYNIVPFELSHGIIYIPSHSMPYVNFSEDCLSEINSFFDVCNCQVNSPKKACSIYDSNEKTEVPVPESKISQTMGKMEFNGDYLFLPNWKNSKVQLSMACLLNASNIDEVCMCQKDPQNCKFEENKETIEARDTEIKVYVKADQLRISLAEDFLTPKPIQQYSQFNPQDHLSKLQGRLITKDHGKSEMPGHIEFFVRKSKLQINGTLPKTLVVAAIYKIDLNTNRIELEIPMGDLDTIPADKHLTFLDFLEDQTKNMVKNVQRVWEALNQNKKCDECKCEPYWPTDNGITTVMPNDEQIEDQNEVGKVKSKGQGSTKPVQESLEFDKNLPSKRRDNVEVVKLVEAGQRGFVKSQSRKRMENDDIDNEDGDEEGDDEKGEKSKSQDNTHFKKGTYEKAQKGNHSSKDAEEVAEVTQTEASSDNDITEETMKAEDVEYDEEEEKLNEDELENTEEVTTEKSSSISEDLEGSLDVESDSKTLDEDQTESDKSETTTTTMIEQENPKDEKNQTVSEASGSESTTTEPEYDYDDGYIEQETVDAPEILSQTSFKSPTKEKQEFEEGEDYYDEDGSQSAAVPKSSKSAMLKK